jgi:outer membrane protein assembly factor BamA
MDRTQSNLSRLGIFSAINIEVTPDTVSSKKILDVAISCTFDSPLEASVEVNASSKSNSYIGPGMTFGVTNRNIFGGGEQFNVNLTGTYEWQTGKGSGRSIFNSYEVGLTTSLSFPRLLAPKFIPRRNRQLNWTKISLNADLLNRPHYFKMAQFNAAFSYDWQATRHVYNSLSLFKLTYTNLINTTAAFDSIMAENQAVALSFQSQFIPQIAYSYTYDRDFGNNTLNWQFTLQEAGNIFWSIWELAGQHGEKKLFDTPFSQFVKGTTQLVWGHRLGGEHWLVTRAAVGAAHAYGNSSQVPYAEQFYVGGANSVRAFTVRSIGPGSYRAPGITANDYFDQTGTFKFEFNSEYRFPILGPLHGALFLDAGNVWLLKSDAQRPGGELKASTFLKDLALGTGCGLRFDIGMLVLRGDLGIGIHAPYETGKRGYYNMTSFKDSLAFHLAIGYPF